VQGKRTTSASVGTKSRNVEIKHRIKRAKRLQFACSFYFFYGNAKPSAAADYHEKREQLVRREITIGNQYTNERTDEIIAP